MRRLWGLVSLVIMLGACGAKPTGPDPITVRPPAADAVDAAPVAPDAAVADAAPHEISILPPPTCAGDANILGYIRDVRTGEVLYGATVVLVPAGGGVTVTAIADERGIYCASVEPGRWTLDVYYNEATLHVEVEVHRSGPTVVDELFIDPTYDDGIVDFSQDYIPCNPTDVC